MSNPGVITLAEKELSATKKIRVEDNLGEAIHFHYNDIRIDATIKELIYIAGICDATIYDLVKADGFDLNDFQGDFLNAYSQCLMDLQNVKEDSVKVCDVYFQTTNLLHLPVRRKMNRNRAEKIIKSYEFDDKRKKEKYKPVFFNDAATVMYGDYEIARLYLENADNEVNILRMHFENNKYDVSNHPWVPFLFSWNKKRIVSVAKKIAMKLLG